MTPVQASSKSRQTLFLFTGVLNSGLCTVGSTRAANPAAANRNTFLRVCNTEETFQNEYNSCLGLVGFFYQKHFRGFIYLIFI